MKFILDKPVKIIMLGAGGTGGYIAPHLYRLLHTLERPVKVIIVDGDIVEEKNLIRQNFVASDIGRNKAQVLAERYECVKIRPKQKLSQKLLMKLCNFAGLL